MARAEECSVDVGVEIDDTSGVIWMAVWEEVSGLGVSVRRRVGSMRCGSRGGSCGEGSRTVPGRRRGRRQETDVDAVLGSETEKGVLNEGDSLGREGTRGEDLLCW